MLISLNDMNFSHEEKNADIINQIAEKLQRKYHPREVVSDKNLNANSHWRWGLFIVLLGVEMLPMAVGGLVYARTAFDFLPFVFPTNISLFLGISINLVHCIVSYSFQASLLKQRLGIKEEKQQSLPNLYQQQLQSTIKINKILSEDNNISSAKYKQYATVAKHFNQTMNDLKTDFPDYKEKNFFKIVRLIMTGINLIQSMGGAWFMIGTMLTMVAPSIAGTTIGTGLAAIWLGCQLGTQLIFRSASMFNMINPLAQEYEATKAEFNKFEHKTVSEFDLIYTKKKTYEKLVWLKQKNKLVMPLALNSMRFYNQKKRKVSATSPGFSHIPNRIGKSLSISKKVAF
jgi:hypothetical protein